MPHNIRNFSFISALFLLLPLFSGCSDDRLQVDVSGHETTVEIKRLDSSLFAPPPAEIDNAAIARLQKEYGDYFNLYAGAILRMGSPDMPGFDLNLRRFLTDADMRDVYKDIKQQYPDLSFLKDQLSDAFTHYHYYFPDSIIPLIVTSHNGFHFATVTTQNVLGIGLEMYMGPGYRKYAMMNSLHQYQLSTMKKEYMAADAMRGWIGTSFPEELSGKNLVEHMIHYGKILYLTKATMPDAPDSLITGFTSREIQWAMDHEEDVWGFFVERELLYSTQTEEVTKMTTDGPFTPGMPAESPGGIARWTGYRIVQSFMEENEQVTIQQMITLPAEEIFRKSKYRPS